MSFAGEARAYPRTKSRTMSVDPKPKRPIRTGFLSRTAFFLSSKGDSGNARSLAYEKEVIEARETVDRGILSLRSDNIDSWSINKVVDLKIACNMKIDEARFVVERLRSRSNFDSDFEIFPGDREIFERSKSTIENFNECASSYEVFIQLFRDVIDKKLAELSKLPVDERISAIENLAIRGEEFSLSEILHSAFPELWHNLAEAKPAALPLPTSAPMAWSSLSENGRDGRKPGESPPEFTKRVYGQWIEARQMTRADLKQLDPKLYQALATWVGRHGAPDFDLPTRREVNDRWIERVAGDPEAAAARRDATRLESAIRRREKARTKDGL